MTLKPGSPQDAAADELLLNTTHVIEPTMAARPGLLTNSAAEFVEARGGHVAPLGISQEVESAQGALSQLKFAPELDRFISSGEAEPEVSRQESQDRLRKFEATLASFTKNAKTREAFKSLGLAIKNPDEYNLTYVLDVTNKIVDRREDNTNASVCKKFARNICATANKQSTILNALLGMVPNDAYGSIIGGAFGTILAVAEKRQKMREEIQNALASIPKVLDRVQRLSEVYVKSRRLHECADQIFLAIFVVLERIVDRLTASRSDKLKSTFKKNPEETHTDALAKLDTCVTDFQNEVEICASIRMGRMDEGLQGIHTMVHDIRSKLDETTRIQPASEANLEKALYNTLYRLFAANPNFNTIDGTVDLKRLAIDASVEKTEAATMRRLNQKVVDDWHRGVQDMKTDSAAHVAEILSRGTADMSLEELDKVEWILASGKLQSWLSLGKSHILVLTAESSPDELVNPLSLVNASLASTLGRATGYPVLSFFCGLRTNEDYNADTAGPKGLLQCLNSQLLRFIRTNRPGLDLGFMDNQKFMKRSITKREMALALFERLLYLFPEHDAVFIIIDSFYRLCGDKVVADSVLENMARIAKNAKHIVVKMLVTEPLPGCSINGLAHLTLQVPDEIDGWRVGVNMSSLEHASQASVGRLKKEQSKRQSQQRETEDTSSEEDSDESSW
jgi:hypothetical protein